jgi:hypothetical protein
VLRRLLIVSAALAGLWAAPAHASTFCGTPGTADRSPNVVAGHPVHVVYAVPSDGTDRFAQFATQAQTDSEQIDAWWRGQDPTRTLRFDLFPYPCGNQLDLSSVRFGLAGAQLAPTETRFQAIAQALDGVGLLSDFVKTLVYYDGPVADTDVCGTGGGDAQGVGLAIVFVNACAGIPTVTVAAHELIHALGAVPDGAPHECPAPNDHHTCDSPPTQDIMYPFADGTSLGGLLLDPGRDDYYGHSGSFWDVQDSKWLIALNSQVTLTVAISGGGAVASDVPGLSCTASCDTTWNAGTQLTLTPKPAGGMRFVRWTGACAGSASCRVQLAQAASANAVFGPASFALSVVVSGHGTVRVGSSGTCSARCSKAVTSFVPVQLQEKPAAGWRFKAWSGACRGTKPTCSVPMSAAAQARATFFKVPKKK